MSDRAAPIPRAKGQLISTKNTAMVKATQKNAIIQLPYRVAESTSGCARACADYGSGRSGDEKAASPTQTRASQCRTAAERQRSNKHERKPHRTFPRRRNYRFCILTVDEYELLTGDLVVGLPLTNPLLQGRFARGLHGRPSANGLPMLVINPRLIGASPEQHFVEPSPVNPLRLDFGLHPRVVGLKRDRTIALSTVKLTRGTLASLSSMPAQEAEELLKRGAQ